MAKSDPMQMTIGWLFPHSRPLVTPAEAATVLAVSPDQVRDLVEARDLVGLGIQDSAATTRTHLRVARWSVEAFYLHRLEGQGFSIPYPESPETSWWKTQLKKPAHLRAEPTTNK